MFRSMPDSEIPAAWQLPLSQAALQDVATKLNAPVSRIHHKVCFSLPEHPLSLAYQSWMRTSHQTNDSIPVVIENWAAWNQQNGEQAWPEQLESFSHDRRPSLKYLNRIFYVQ